MTEMLTACPTCAEINEDVAALYAQLTAAAKRETALRNKLAQEMKTGPLMNEISEVFDHWLVVCRPNAKRLAKLDAKRIGAVRARLKDPWTVDELKRSIDGWATDGWTMGRDRKTKGATRLSMVERLMADSGMVEAGLALADQRASGDTSPKAASRAAFADRPTDPGSAVRRVLAALEVRNLKIVNRAGGWEAQCPAHDDRTPSLGVDPAADSVLVRCRRGCSIEEITDALGLEMGALFDTWVDERDRPMPRALHRTNGKMPDKPQQDPLPSDDDLAAWHRALLENAAALKWLFARRRWSRPTLERFQIGLNGGRLIFPVRDADGGLLTIARYKPQPKDGEAKMLGLTLRGRYLFPAPETVDGDPLWLVEGEPDKVSAFEMGLGAVAIPGVEWAKGDRLAALPGRLAGHTVVVCLDCDDPGRECTARVAAALTAGGVETVVVDLALGRTDGYDVGDVLVEHGPARGADIMRDLVASATGPQQLGIGAAA